MPGDKSISHRAAMLAGLGQGDCSIEGFLASEDCLATLHAMQALGAGVLYPDGDRENAENGNSSAAGRMLIQGTGMRLRAPSEPIDCGNSGTTMRLLSGILAGQPFTTTLVGDASLSRRPMGRVMEPIAQMGARFEAAAGGTPPLTIHGSQNLAAIDYQLPVASAQVKSAILLAGLFADGATTVIEPTPTRDHTERMFALFGILTEREGAAISIRGGQVPQAQAGSVVVPGDISSAAFWLVAAAALPGACVKLECVGLNPTRTGILEVLAGMGCRIESVIESPPQGEPYGSITVTGSELQGVEIGGEIIANVIDELPILAVAGALAKGKTVIRDAEELRVKETDRITAVAANLRAFGVEVEEAPDGMTIHGGARLRGATVKSFGDHRIAMAFAVAGLYAEGETIIEDSGCIATSYPNFQQHLGQIRGPIHGDHS